MAREPRHGFRLGLAVVLNGDPLAASETGRVNAAAGEGLKRPMVRQRSAELRGFYARYLRLRVTARTSAPVLARCEGIGVGAVEIEASGRGGVHVAPQPEGRGRATHHGPGLGWLFVSDTPVEAIPGAFGGEPPQAAGAAALVSRALTMHGRCGSAVRGVDAISDALRGGCGTSQVHEDVCGAGRCSPRRDSRLLPAPQSHATSKLNRKELNPLNTRGMKRLSIAVLRDDTRAVVERLERAMDPMSDGGTAITPREAREALRPARRADARAAYLHDVTAVAHALEREAITPHYIADLTTRLRSRAEELDPVPA